MLITKKMMEDGDMTPERLKLWVKAMSADIKATKPSFCLADHGVYGVRARLAPRSPARLTHLTLAKGDEFVLDSVVQEPNIHRDEVKVLLSFLPTTAKLKEEGVISLTCTLDEALTFFEGMNDWVNGHATTADDAIEARIAAAPKAPPKPPLPEELEASPEWGAW